MRVFLKIGSLAGLLVLHVPLAAFSCLRRRRRVAHSSTHRDVLIVTPFPPGEESGGARAVKDFVAVVERCAAVEIVSMRSFVPVRGWRARLGAALSWPLPIPPHCRPLIAGHPQLVSVMRHVDVVVFEFFATAVWQYLHLVPARRVIVRDHEVLVRKIAMARQATRGIPAFVLLLRLAICYLVSLGVYMRADRILTLTEEDRCAVLEWFPWLADRVGTLPISFDIPPTTASQAPAERRVRDLAFVANFFHRPNVDALLWFLRECGSHLGSEFTLHLYGLDGPLDGLDLSSHALFVVRHGFVEDLATAMARPMIAVAPVISGGGIRIKNLTLASLGKAIVTTHLGNQGIGFRDGYDAVVTDDGVEMARRIRLLSEAPDEVVRLGDRARDLVRSRFSPDAVLERTRTELAVAVPGADPSVEKSSRACTLRDS